MIQPATIPRAWHIAGALASAIALACYATSAQASHAFYVGKALTEDHAVLVGGTGEEVSSHWLEIVPAADHESGETIEVGVTAAAAMPGERSEIAQVGHTFRYLSMFYSDYEGFPAPLTNGGINEHQVAVRDVWAPNRQALVEMTPEPQHGLQYSDLARLVLERAHTAREGVELIGKLIAEHGYATYGGNTHLIADPNEAWVVWEFAGGQGLWAAERLGENDVRVLYPGYIEDFPRDHGNDPDYMGAPNLVSFAVDRGWLAADGDATFNLFEVYGKQDAEARTGGFKYMTQAALEQATRAMAPMSVADMIERVRDPRISDDEAGYGQVAKLEAGTDADLVRIWVAPTGSVAAPYIPWWLGVEKVPMSYGQHRYLTKNAGATFLDPDYRDQEASDFAGRRFKQVLYRMCSQPKAYLPVVTRLLEGFEARSRADMPWVESSARTLIANDRREQARALLTFYSNTRAEQAMDLGETMVDALAAHAELVAGERRPRVAAIDSQGGETVNCLIDADPDQPKTAQHP